MAGKITRTHVLIKLLLVLLCKGVLCNQITQTPSALTAEMGNQAKIFCNYATTYSNPDLYWYRQLSDNTLQFILYRDNSQSRDAEFTKGRFAVERDLAAKTFHLVISPVGSEDAASYYCAIRAGYVLDIRKLIFGKGTKVTVEPKNPEPSSPSVFVVKSANAKPSDGNKLTAACLVKDFFPKNIKVNMSQETDTVYKSKEGILSSNGKYSMIQVVKVEPNEDVGCYVTHEGINYNQTKPQSAPTTAPINNTQVCESSNSMVEEPNMEKVNMLSVTVLGLRVLLAKSIAFNMLMTVKLFIF